MFVTSAQPPCPIILTDFRTGADKVRDEQCGGCHVLHDWHIGRYAYTGLRYLNRTMRVALFNSGDVPDERARAKARHKLRRWLDEQAPSRIYILPNATGTEELLPATLCWQFLDAPDAVSAMRGTCWERNQHVFTPLYPFSPILKELQQVQQAQWLRRWQEPLLRCERRYTEVGAPMLNALMGMHNATHIAVDIETMTTGNLITAIGLSDGKTAVSLPYDTYRPYQHEEDEPGWASYGEMGRMCYTAIGHVLAGPQIKVLHNYTFDVPRLHAEGFHIGGEIHDTLAAHAIAFPELSHGLQHACASLLNVPPWKSLHHPRIKNITRDDEEFWIADPVALRYYNCDDAFYDWHLALKLFPSVEVVL